MSSLTDATAAAPSYQNSSPGTAPASWCSPYAKTPTGEPISATFLTRALGAPGYDVGAVAEISGFRVDEASVIQGRHSTTFRLLLDWSSSPTDPSRRAAERAASAAGAVDDTTPSIGAGSATCNCHLVGSVFVKRMTCAELPPRSLKKWRTSIASYRAEATFFKTFAGSKVLSGIAPHAFWVHVDDRLGEEKEETGIAAVGGCGGGGGRLKDEEEVVKALRESCFMMITEDLSAETSRGCDMAGCPNNTCHGEQGSGAISITEAEEVTGWEQFGALDIDRARAILSAVAHLHASFWPSPTAATPPPPPAAATPVSEQGLQYQQQQQRTSLTPAVNCRQHRGEAGGGGYSGGDGRGRYADGLHEQGTFWSLEKRDPGDLAGLEQEYQKLFLAFRPLLPATWFDDALPSQQEAAKGCHGADGKVGKGSHGLSEDHHQPSGESGERKGGREPLLGHRLAARAVELDGAAHATRAGGTLAPPSGGEEPAAAAAGGRRGVHSGQGGGGRGRTLVHGDLKTWNVFFKRGGWRGAGAEGAGGGGGGNGGGGGGAPMDAAGGRVKIIDWQWCGEGLAAADVAYVMCTSLEPSLLSKERELLDQYHAELCRGLEARFGKPPPVGEEDEGADGGDRSSSWYPWEQFVDDYRVAFLDYMRCVVGTIWKGLTPEKMERNRSSGPGMSLINRSPQHLQWMIEKASRLLDQLDSLERGE